VVVSDVGRNEEVPSKTELEIILISDVNVDTPFPVVVVVPKVILIYSKDDATDDI
jgi:hypothetical protein